MGRDLVIVAGRATFPLTGLQLPLMFVVVAVQTQQLPIAAIRRVVVVIVITVVNGQLTQIGACEHSSAAATDPRINLQSSLTIALSPLVGGAPRVGHDSIQLARVFRFHAVILPADD